MDESGLFDILATLARELPSAGVAVFMVYLGLKYISKRDEILERSSQAFVSAENRCSEALQENARVMGELRGVLMEFQKDGLKEIREEIIKNRQIITKQDPVA